MSWFKRKEKGVKTPTEEKKEVPDGLWYKSPKSKKLYFMPELKTNAFVCEEDSYHVRIGSAEYFEILFDDNKFKEIDINLQSTDPLGFVDNKPYKERIKAAQEKTKLKEACRTAIGKLNDIEIVICCMDFTFIGGSMGTIVGEKICRAISQSLKKKIPFLMISKSGGARMMEAGLSLMQMARTSARLQQLNEAKIPYISLMTDPTTGGVTASFAMLGDFNIAEPDALIGFAGPRVIKETIGKDLPKGFQRSEFLLEHGFLDFIVDRRQLKKKLTQLLNMIDKKTKTKKKNN